MENIIIQIEQFLLKNAWGVIIAGVIASILGSFLCYIFRKMVNYIQEKLQIRKKKHNTIKYALGFYRGAAAEYSKYSSYRQILLVGDIIMDALYVGLKIVVYLLIAIIFINLLNDVFLDLTIIAIVSFMIYPQLSKFKDIRKAYELTYDHIFGKDFTKKCIDGAFETLEKEQKEKDDVPNEKSVK
mgnify:FL=1